MDFSQFKARGTPITGTQLLLTALVSVALLGALATQWVRRYSGTGAPIASGTPPTSLNQQGMVPGRTSLDNQGVVFSRDYILWSLVATRSVSGISVDLSYKRGSARDLQEYTAMNKVRAGKLSQGGGIVDVQVTFRSLLSPELFRKWVSARGMVAKFVSLRLDVDGARGTLTVAAREDDPLPKDALNTSSGTLPPPLGVYSVRGFVPAERLPDMISNSWVFVADVTPTLARLDLEESGIPGAKEASINIASPFDDLEDFGLVEATP